MDYLKRAREVLDIELAGIGKVKANLGEGFEQAIDAILEVIGTGCGKVVIAGVGKNWHIGNKMAATLTSTGTPAVAMHPIEAMHGDFGITVDPGPVVFENVGHEAASWDVATNNQGNVGTGDYTSWFETSHPTGGSTLAFANVQFKRSGSCGSIREIDAADFRVPRELESLVPMEGPIEAPVSER